MSQIEAKYITNIEIVSFGYHNQENDKDNKYGAVSVCTKLFGVVDPVILSRVKYDELTEELEELKSKLNELQNLSKNQ